MYIITCIYNLIYNYVMLCDICLHQVAFTRDGLCNLWNELVKDGEIIVGPDPGNIIKEFDKQMI